MKRLTNRKFFLQPAEMFAPKLLGKIICRRWHGDILRYRIIETEAYCMNDTACHANRGKTLRNAPMFEIGGTSYVYLCYGIHEMFNIVCNEAGVSEAVLIRGVEGFSGPGKLTKALKIDRSQNNIDLLTSDELWLEDDGSEPQYKETTRVGIDYADVQDREKLLRFVVK